MSPADLDRAAAARRLNAARWTRVNAAIGIGFFFLAGLVLAGLLLIAARAA